MIEENIYRLDKSFYSPAYLLDKPPFKIVAKRLPIAEGIAGHLYLQITDAKGAILQIDGLATDRKNGYPKIVGTPLDALFANINYPPKNPNSEKHESVVLFSTDNPHEMQKAILAMNAKAEVINHKDADYGLITSNSNAVFSQMVAAAASVVPIKPEDIQKAKSMGLTNPGVDSEIKRSSESHEAIKIGKAVAEEVINIPKSAGELSESIKNNAIQKFNSISRWVKHTFLEQKQENKNAEDTPKENNQKPELHLKPSLQPSVIGYVPLETPFVKSNNAASKINIA